MQTSEDKGTLLSVPTSSILNNILLKHILLQLWVVLHITYTLNKSSTLIYTFLLL